MTSTDSFLFSRAQGGSTPLGRIRTRLSELAQNLGVSDYLCHLFIASFLFQGITLLLLIHTFYG